MGEQEPIESIENSISCDVSIQDFLEENVFPEDVRKALESLPKGTVLYVFNDIETGEQMISTTFLDDESILEYVITTTSDGMKFKCSFYTESGKYMGKISDFYYKDIDGKYPPKNSE